MKFIQLDILNLASLDRPSGETINFVEGALGESNIFSIVGPTGSGKSTILDAICLALYNRAPRYPRQKRDQNRSIVVYGDMDSAEKNRLAPTDGRNILTRGRKDGYSKLTFMANNGCLYRAEWHIHFKNKTYDNPVLNLFKITGTGNDRKEETANWEDLPQIIGLDYDQFLSTVLIAQGSFADFLNAKEDDRYNLLEKLVGCEEMYVRIANGIKQKKKEADQELERISTQLSAINQDLIKDPEQLQQLKEEIGQLEAMEQKIKEELVKVNEELLWYTQEETHVANVSRFQDAFDKALAALSAIKDDCDRLKLHDITLPAVAFYEDMDDNRKDIALLTKSQEELTQQEKQQEERIRQEEQRLTELKETATKANELLEQQKPHINLARTIKGELAASVKAMAEKQKTQQDCVTSHQKAVKTLDANLAAIKQVEKVELIGQTSQKLQETKDKATQTLSDLKEAIRVRHELDEALAANSRETIEQNKLQERVKEILCQLSALSIESLTSEVKTLSNSLTLLTSKNLEQLRRDLVEGKPCPVCGATHHPYEAEETFKPVVNDLSTLLAQKESLLAQQNKAQQQLTQEQGEATGRLKELNNHIAQLGTTISSLQQGWDGIVSNHKEWPSDEEQLRGMETPAKHAVRQATDLFNDFITLETERGKTGNLKQQLQEKETALNASNEALKQAQDEVKAKQEVLMAEVGNQDPDELEKRLNEAKTKADNEMNAQIEKIGKLREGMESTRGSLKATTERNKEKQLELDRNQKQLDAWLTEYNDSHDPQIAIELIAELFGSECDWEEIRHKQQRLNDERTSAQTTLTNEKTAHEKHQEKKPAESKESLLTRKAELSNHSNAVLVEKKTLLKRHEDAAAKAGPMQEELNEKAKRQKDWEEINDSIGGDGKTLRKIAQCYTLRFLVEHANAEIRKFNSRYELVQVKNSLGLRVIDHDRADDVRDTTSLSGGETFIVSLGLALGLSSLSSRNISFENLFIDEGFGTLDPDTLAVVIDSLAMLQNSQGKKVGVISHTDTMSERISTQIRIIKNGSSGSSHIEIYPN